MFHTCARPFLCANIYPSNHCFVEEAALHCSLSYRTVRQATANIDQVQQNINDLSLTYSLQSICHSPGSCITSSFLWHFSFCSSGPASAAPLPVTFVLLVFRWPLILLKFPSPNIKLFSVILFSFQYKTVKHFHLLYLQTPTSSTIFGTGSED